jgi:hypothetical protein
MSNTFTNMHTCTLYIRALHSSFTHANRPRRLASWMGEARIPASFGLCPAASRRSTSSSSPPAAAHIHVRACPYLVSECSVGTERQQSCCCLLLVRARHHQGGHPVLHVCVCMHECVQASLRGILTHTSVCMQTCVFVMCMI